MSEDVTISLKRVSIVLGVAGTLVVCVASVWSMSAKHAEAMKQIETNTSAIELLATQMKEQQAAHTVAEQRAAKEQAKTNELLGRMDERLKAIQNRP